MQSILDRLESVQKTTDWGWEVIAKELGRSVSLLMQAKSGKRKLSAKSLHRLSELEKRIGIVVQDCATDTVPEPPSKPVVTSGLGVSDVLTSLSVAGLKHSMSDIAGQLPEASNETRGRLMRALCVIDEEMKRRGDANS